MAQQAELDLYLFLQCLQDILFVIFVYPPPLEENKERQSKIYRTKEAVKVSMEFFYYSSSETWNTIRKYALNIQEMGKMESR